jgi:hypothetical protein
MSGVIDNPVAVAYANRSIRTFADRLADLFYKSLRDDAEYDAQELGLHFSGPGGANLEKTLIDGSPTDGRPSIKGGDVAHIVAIRRQITALLQADGGALLNAIMRVAPQQHGLMS